MGEFHPESLLRLEVLELEPYVPILPFEALSRKLGRPVLEIVKLDANENPYGPLPAALEALRAYPYYHIYPDPQQTELCEALGGSLRLPAEHILPTHGADEMIDMLCRMFLRSGDCVVNCPPTFGMYEFDTALAGAQALHVPRRTDFALDIEAIEACWDNSRSGAPPKVLFLTSPNNPSGNWLPDDELERLLALPALVVLDEAYVDFADHTSRADRVLQHGNLVVLRTFSKAAGIAGLRLGYGVCPVWLMAHLWTFKQPYNVNAAATAAGLATLRHGEEVHETVERIKRTRAWALEALATITWLRPYPSQANFILCDVVGQDARRLKADLETRGILVRYYDKPGLRNCIRISIGTDVQMEILIEALKSHKDAAA